jgi:hypothetical protein
MSERDKEIKRRRKRKEERDKAKKREAMGASTKKPAGKRG